MRNLKMICFIVLLLTICQTLIAQTENGLQTNKSVDNVQTPSCIPPTQPLVLFCDGNTPNSIKVDFNNAGQSAFQYSYTIDGGTAITGSFNSPSNYTVSGLTSGQTVVFTLTWVGLCGTNSKTITCSAECTNTIAPNFAPIQPLCGGSASPVLQTTSPNGVTGTWSPATINNTTSGTYTFTPSSTCSTSQTLTVTVLPKVSPTFSPLPSVCQNAPAPVLPQSSTNVPPITGTWSPAVTTTNVGTRSYTFTPNAGQCTVTTPITLSLTVMAAITPNFPAIPAFCSGSTPPVLATTSPNGISGTWSPPVVNATIPATYIFTPDPGQCASTKTLSTTITPGPKPTFNPISPFCAGTVAPVLPTTSLQGITGVWLPPVIDNLSSASYQFVPNPGQCATPILLDVIVHPLLNPNFDDISICANGVIPMLNTTSPNGIQGVWSPSTIDGQLGGSYEFTPNEGECASQQTIQVSIDQPTLSNVTYTLTNPFTDNQVITVMASAPGNYLYQLDSGSLSESNIFTYVTPGTHSVTVFDANGCSDPITINEVRVLNYPHYFTPNEDGRNDYWQIFGLTSDSKIFIFDRYGKLMKQLSPDSPGWDGTFLGTPAPSSDYWFSLFYNDKSVLKEFTAHFTLKR